MSLQSTSIFDRRVYAQDSAPSDERDGVMWVDTDSADNDLYVYDVDSASWVLAAPENITIADTAPSGANLGDGWIDTSQTPPRFRIYDGGSWVEYATVEELYSPSVMASGSLSVDTGDTLFQGANHDGSDPQVSVYNQGMTWQANLYVPTGKVFTEMLHSPNGTLEWEVRST